MKIRPIPAFRSATHCLGKAGSAAVLVLLACGEGGTSTEPIPQEGEGEGDGSVQVSRVQVTPSQSEILEGDFVDLVAQVFDTQGSKLTDQSIEWRSSDPVIVSVSATGRATALLPGSAWIVASAAGTQDSASISVLQRAVGIDIIPASATMRLGETIALLATVTDARGDAVEGRVPIWRTSDPSVAALEGGTIVARALGSATITAELDGAQGSASILVAPRRFLAVSAGGLHTCGITTDQEAYCWGFNSLGQLGDGSMVDHLTPVRVLGDYRFSQISAGAGYTCGITTANLAYCWGDNAMMELGNPDPGRQSSVPIHVVTEERYVTVSTGQLSHACALRVGGGAFCWGYNRFGMVGNGSVAHQRFPLPVVGDVDFRSVHSAFFRTCGITALGDAYCWGRGGHAQLANTSVVLEVCSLSLPCITVPVKVNGGIEFLSITTGSAHTCGISLGGEAYCWGWNESGQLGIGSVDSTVVPTTLSGGVTFIQISAAELHTCGVDSQSMAHCWGYNGDGRLGTGSNVDANAPQAVAGGHSFVAVSAGWTHTCGLTDDGTVYCWGDNFRGQLGDGTTVNRETPQQLQF